MAKKIIYIVTEGDYSDYRICGVFSTKPKAQDFIDVTPDRFSNYEIEEWPLDEYEILIEKFKKKELSIYVVSMFRNGDVEEVKEEEKKSLWIDDATKGEYNLWTENRIGMWVIAKDEKHAVKIVNEKRTQLIAENKWPEKKEE